MTADEDITDNQHEVSSEQSSEENDPDEPSSLRGFIDLGSAVVMTLLGLAGLVGGPLITQLADEEWIQEVIEAEEEAMEGIDEAEFVDLLATGIWWSDTNTTPPDSGRPSCDRNLVEWYWYHHRCDCPA